MWWNNLKHAWPWYYHKQFQCKYYKPWKAFGWSFKGGHLFNQLLFYMGSYGKQNKDWSKFLSSWKCRKMNVIITSCSSFRCQMLLFLQLPPLVLCSVLSSKEEERGGGMIFIKTECSFPSQMSVVLHYGMIMLWDGHHCINVFLSLRVPSLFSPTDVIPCCLTATDQYMMLLLLIDIQPRQHRQ